MKQQINIIICCLTIITVAFLAGTILDKKSRSNDSLTVTGLASRDFVSDIITWEGSFTRKDLDLKSTYAALETDRKVVEEYLLSKGVKSGEYVFSAVNIEKSFKDVFNTEGNKIDTLFIGYTLTQKVRIESSEVEKIEATSREITKLINDGLEFYSEAPEYYYSKLAELKIQMVAEATKDARTRAENIAQNAKGHLAGLRYSSLGVFQIIAPNSNEEITWDGTVNRSSKKKTVMLTVKLQFGLD